MTCTSGFNELINFCVFHEYLLHALVQVDARPYRITTLSLIQWVIDCSIKTFFIEFSQNLIPTKINFNVCSINFIPFDQSNCSI